MRLRALRTSVTWASTGSETLCYQPDIFPLNGSISMVKVKAQYKWETPEMLHIKLLVRFLSKLLTNFNVFWTIVLLKCDALPRATAHLQLNAWVTVVVFSVNIQTIHFKFFCPIWQELSTKSCRSKIDLHCRPYSPRFWFFSMCCPEPKNCEATLKVLWKKIYLSLNRMERWKLHSVLSCPLQWHHHSSHDSKVTHGAFTEQLLRYLN